VKLAPRTTHSPNQILILTKVSIVTRNCEHPQGQFNRLWDVNAKRIFASMQTIAKPLLEMPQNSDNSALERGF
jgi:hypothetical protein